MKIYIAAITHKHGVALYAALTEADRIAKIADYCRQNWDAMSEKVCEETKDRTLSDDEAIRIYFSSEEMGSHEYVEMQEDEAWEPGDVPADPVARTHPDVVAVNTSAIAGVFTSPRAAPIDPYLGFPVLEVATVITPPADADEPEWLRDTVGLYEQVNLQRQLLLQLDNQLTQLRGEADKVPHGLELNAPHFLTGMMEILSGLIQVAQRDQVERLK